MFSKLLALGLGALAVVHAAPAFSFQTPLLSCSVNLDASIAPVKAFNAIPSGNYRIYNEAFGQRPLRVFGPDQAVWVGPEVPGDYAKWFIAPSGNPGSNEYIISNIGSKTGTKVTRGMVVSTAGKGDSFTISPAGEGTYTIQIPNEDEVWTVNGGDSVSNVFLGREQGEIESRWIFVPA
ncbi:hypothetical protein MSAN_01647500 [Mycena sanguinolenta]|uniref:Uncharacterized protein n=1 Tax=Mycena sanguinolenta TaxID=230812 RepID=A0A8H6Y2P7_9AGAR|nr:hypothetical protein MSAN_01647500 [Mycena sanguinolenta]